MKRAAVFQIAAFLLILPCAHAPAEQRYPLVHVLSHDDALFVQQQAELDDFRRLMESRSGEPGVMPNLDIFAYVPRKDEDLFSLNARLGLRYDTLASLNGAASKDAFSVGGQILIPSQDGLFVNDPPRSELEAMVLGTRLAAGRQPVNLQVWRSGGWEKVSFFPDESFSRVERAYFLRILYRTPIDKGHITSLYGWRTDPFTGTREFHGGLDIGAAEGTPVHAARDGTVEEVSASDLLGRYVLLTHRGDTRRSMDTSLRSMLI